MTRIVGTYTKVRGCIIKKYHENNSIHKIAAAIEFTKIQFPMTAENNIKISKETCKGSRRGSIRAVSAEWNSQGLNIKKKT